MLLSSYWLFSIDKRTELRAINNVKDVLYVIPLKCVECRSNAYFTYMDMSYLLKNHR